ncbi:MAG: hypothetical protein M1837_007188 [Sclerophora amabilis]|nr:MAG: hypothetical protein M1837_007188 [Sclerophora amabilis]
MSELAVGGSLRIPFLSPTHLDGGATSHVFAVSTNIVIKIARRFDHPTPDQRIHSDEAIESVEREKSIYELLGVHRHPNFVQSFLCTTDGIFLQRLPETLHARLLRQEEDPSTEPMQHMWIKQLASAATWLERLDYFHGDMRPSNILLDGAGHVKLCDFGNTTKRGEQLPGASYPFYRVTAKFDAPIAGPASEQFAMASCIYTIRRGHEPLHQLDGPQTVQALIKRDLPPTGDDASLGGIVYQGWHEAFETMSHLEQAIKSTLADCKCTDASRVMDRTVYKEGVTECLEFLEKERRLADV